MIIKFEGALEASPLATSAEEIKAIIEEALKNICPAPYSVKVNTEEV